MTNDTHDRLAAMERENERLTAELAAADRGLVAWEKRAMRAEASVASLTKACKEAYSDWSNVPALADLPAQAEILNMTLAAMQQRAEAADAIVGNINEVMPIIAAHAGVEDPQSWLRNPHMASVWCRDTRRRAETAEANVAALSEALYICGMAGCPNAAELAQQIPAQAEVYRAAHAYCSAMGSGGDERYRERLALWDEFKRLEREAHRQQS